MLPEKFPLLNLFQRLRTHGLPLGVDDYTAILRILCSGFGIQDQKSLEQVCAALWTTSTDERRLLQRLFRQTLSQSLLPLTHSTDTPSEESLSIQTEEKDEDSASAIENPTPTTMPSSGPDTLLPSLPKHDEPVQVVQAVRYNRLNQHEVIRSRFALSTEYFPVTRRQMKQSWRHLRRYTREGPPQELDVMATLDKVGREGILLEPVLVPRRRNRAELVLLMDQDGSMIPFHALSRQLIETAQRGGRLRQTGVYYFHDYPSNYIFRDPARLVAVPISNAFSEMGERSVVLIVGDAGAARGNFDSERVEHTRLFIQQLSLSIRRYAWLNPMPQSRWRNTTAEDIAGFVPMFELNRSGFDASVNLLQGVYRYGETVLR